VLASFRLRSKNFRRILAFRTFATERLRDTPVVRHVFLTACNVSSAAKIVSKYLLTYLAGRKYLYVD